MNSLPAREASAASKPAQKDAESSMGIPPTGRDVRPHHGRTETQRTFRRSIQHAIASTSQAPCALRQKANDTEDGANEEGDAHHPPTNANERALRQIERGQVPKDEDDWNHQESVEDLSGDIEETSVIIVTNADDSKCRDDRNGNSEVIRGSGSNPLRDAGLAARSNVSTVERSPL